MAIALLVCISGMSTTMPPALGVRLAAPARAAVRLQDTAGPPEVPQEAMSIEEPEPEVKLR